MGFSLLNHAWSRLSRYHSLKRESEEQIIELLEEWKRLLEQQLIPTIDYDKLVYIELNYDSPIIQDLISHIKIWLANRYEDRAVTLQIYGRPTSEIKENLVKTGQQLHDPSATTYFQELRGE